MHTSYPDRVTQVGSLPLRSLPADQLQNRLAGPVNVSAVLDPVNHHHLVRFRDRDLRRHLCLGQSLAASGPRPRL